MMAKMNWYIKDFSKLTNVSVRTLHHYDEIGLLTPSVRKENGYRLYSERDLLKQQQIIALKSFGFKLQEIKALIHDQKNILDNLASQAEILEQKAKSFDQASQLIKEIVAQNKNSESLNWQTTMKIIEVYKTMSELDKTWAGKVLNAEELKSYAQFEQEIDL
jgi:DNA-binding transcriptional MerR regulator